MARRITSRLIQRITGISKAQFAAVDDLSSAELGAIDGVTAGTVTASKAAIVDSNKDIGSFRNVTMTGLLTRASDLSAPVAAGSTLTLTNATHSGRTILLDTLAGSTVTLPAATGSGATFTFTVSVVATSNSHIIKVANASDVIQGLVFTLSDDATAVPKSFKTGASDDTITLNRSTTGNIVIGEQFVIQDIATNKFSVIGFTSSTGTEATPFSATV